MRIIRTAIPALVAFVALAAFVFWVPPAAAAPATQATRTVTITEEEINSRYWVTNPRNRAVTERSVDLQPGQVVITDRIALPRREPVTASATLTPTLADGRVTWTLSALTVNGEPASAELQAQINARINSSWSRYIKQRLGTGRVTALEITDNAITYTVTANS
jgi:hypothetical protein